VFDLGSRETKTPGIEQITWDALPKSDPDYQAMEEKKAAAKRGEREYSEESGDEGDSSPRIPKAARDDKIRALYDQGVPQKKIAATFGIKQGTVSKIVNN